MSSQPSSSREQPTAPLRDPARSREGRFVTWSPDGRFLASTSTVAIVSIHHAASQRTLASMPGPQGAEWGSALAWLLDGTLLAISTTYGRATLWDPFLGEVLDSFGGHRRQVAVAWSADGTTLLTAGEGDATVRRWDARDGRLLSVVRGPSALLSAFSPDTRRLVGHWEAGGFRVWDTRTGRALATLVTLPMGEMVIIGAGGHYAGPPPASSGTWFTSSRPTPARSCSLLRSSPPASAGRTTRSRPRRGR